MKPLLPRDYILVGSIVAAVGLASTATPSTSLPLIVAVGALAALIVICYRSVMRAMRSMATELSRDGMIHYRQLESFAWLISVVRAERPLPPMRGMAISPDFGLVLAQTILATKPRTIVELGCGTSTIISSYMLEQLGGEGRVVSIDHDERFAGACRQQLDEHGLHHRATIHYCALTPQIINGSTFHYYELGGAAIPDAIDLLVVDGPPQWVGRLARYPALPLLKATLSPTATVLIDDAARPDEKEMVRRWLTEFPDLQERYVESEKGTCILRVGSSHSA